MGGGVFSPRLSPDGKRLPFQAEFDPLAAERKKRKYKARAYDSFPIRYWDHWLDETRPHLFVQDLDSPAASRDLLAGTRLAAHAGFDGVNGNSAADLGAIWAPDGRSVIFHAAVERNKAAFGPVPIHLYRADPDCGEPQR